MCSFVDVGCNGDGMVNDIGDVDEVVFSEVMGGYSGGIYVEIVGDKGRVIIGDGVFASSNINEFKDVFDMVVVNILGFEVGKNKVVVCVVVDEFVV